MFSIKTNIRLKNEYSIYFSDKLIFVNTITSTNPNEQQTSLLSKNQKQVLDLCYQAMDSVIRFGVSPEEHIKHETVKHHYDSMLRRLNQALPKEKNDFINRFQTLTETLIKFHDFGEILGEPNTFFDLIRVPDSLKEEFEKLNQNLENTVVKLAFASSFNFLIENNSESNQEQIQKKFSEHLKPLKNLFTKIKSDHSNNIFTDHRNNEEWANDKIIDMKEIIGAIQEHVNTEEEEIKATSTDIWKEYQDMVGLFSWLDSYPSVQVPENQDQQLYANQIKERSKLNSSSFNIARALTHFIDKFDGSTYAINGYKDAFYADLSNHYDQNYIKTKLSKNLQRFEKPFELLEKVINTTKESLEENTQTLFSDLISSFRTQVNELRSKFIEKYKSKDLIKKSTSD